MSAVRRTHLHIELAEIIGRLRTEAGLDQRELASRIGRPQSFVSKVETAERRIDAVDLFTLARGLNVPVETIVDAMRRVVEAAPDYWNGTPPMRRKAVRRSRAKGSGEKSVDSDERPRRPAAQDGPELPGSASKRGQGRAS